MISNYNAKTFHLIMVLYLPLSIFCDEEARSSKLDVDSRLKNYKKPSTLDSYKAAFLETKLIQKDAFKSIERFQDYEKQYKITDQALGKIFEVVTAAKLLVENSDYILGSDLPSNETVAAAVGQIVDNTALFGNFQLKLPDITDRIMNNHPDWLVLMKWAIGFSNSTGIFDAKTIQMIDLLCQEMNLIKREENFINPYRKYDVKVPKESISFHPKQKKVNIKKGPRMTKQRHTEF